MASRERARRTPDKVSTDPLWMLAEASWDAVLLVDGERRIRSANASSERLLDAGPDGLVGRQFDEFLPESERVALEAVWAEAAGAPAHADLRLVRDSGGGRYCAVRIRRDLGPDAALVVVRDLTDERAGVDALARSTIELEHMKTALDESSIVAFTDRKGIITFVNDKFCEISKYDREELLGKDHRIINSGFHPSSFFRDMWRTISSGHVWKGEIRNRAKDGSYYWVGTTIVPFLDAGGHPYQYVAIRTDITSIKESEEALRASEERLREQAMLLDRATDAIILRDLQHRIQFWNKGAERMYGWPAEEALGRDVRELLYNDAEGYDRLQRAFESGAEASGELRQRTRDGREIVAFCRWALIRDESGEPKSVLAINADITATKHLEAQMLRVQRMESIGTLAGGIAHDLNNVFSPIMMSLQLLRMRLPDPSSAQLIETLHAAAQRGSSMVNQVLLFARGASGERIAIQPRHLVKETVKIINETFPKSIEVTHNVPVEVWNVVGDPTQLYQVLMNLCVNARDAMPGGGRLSITASNVVVDDNYARMNIEARPGRFVALVVEDTGSGISASIIDKIFEPFFTTKEQGKGTGIGLSTVIGILKGHGGFVNVYSEPGKGTTFRVHLPVADLPVDETLETATSLPRGHGELVLVVDDEQPIREVCKGTLEQFGYRVVAASDGTEAIAALAERRGEVRAVLLDMMMPIMDGPMTLRALRKLDPDVPVIASSGLPSNEQVMASGDVAAFLPKPYTADTLLQTLADVLGRPS